MTLRRYAERRQSTELARNSLDQNAMVLCGAFVRDININIGWGTSASTCDLTLVQDLDLATGHTTYKEPHVGSALRVAIPNDNPPKEGGIISPYAADQNNPFSRLSFTGIVSSTDENLDSSGQTISIRLTDTKEILQNIPVVLRKQHEINTDKLAVIQGNVVYAFPSGSGLDSKNRPYLNDKGLMIKGVHQAVNNKVFTFFTNNSSGNPNSSGLQRYTVDMSRMFFLRRGKPFGSNIRFATWNENDPFNMFDGDGFDGSYVPEENNNICSPNFRIDGEYKSLLDVINEAMDQNGCDWFVYSEESGSNGLTGKIDNTIDIKIIPIVRNDFDQLTQTEMSQFIKLFDGELVSASFGKELSNVVSNRSFFGPFIERLFETPVSGTKQFWGFKRPEYGVDPVSEITDRYGQPLAVRGSINKNPTFDFGGVPKFDIGENIITKEGLNAVFKTAFNEYGDYQKLEEITTLPSELELDVSDPFLAQAFFCLTMSTKTIQSFRSFMTSVVDYVKWWDKYGGKPNVEDPRIEILSKTGDFDVSSTDSYFLDFSYQMIDKKNDAFVKVDINDGDYFFDIKPQKVESNLNPTEATSFVYKMVLEGKHKAGTPSFLGSSPCCVGLPIFTTGLHKIKITVREWGMVNDAPFSSGESVSVLYLNKTAGGENPYLKMKGSALYQLARRSLCSFLENAVSFDRSSKDTKLAEYWGYFVTMVQERETNIYDVIKNYIETYYNKKFYIPLLEDAQWDVVGEVWDGYSGTFIKHPSIRGKFLNRDTGKMPSVYQIKNIDSLDPENNTDNSAFVFDDFKSGKGSISFWGKASSEVFYANRADDSNKEDGLTVLEQYIKTGKKPDYKKEGEGNTAKILVLTAEAQPKRSVARNGLGPNATLNTIVDDFKNRGENVSSDAIAAVQGWVDFLDNIKGSRTGAESLVSGFMFDGEVPIKPELFFVPSVHRYIRYGPWLLDPRMGRVNRSNFGKTDMSVDEMLNPWTFKDSREAFQYLMDQHQYDLSSEHTMNRGRITVADIPRFNFGQKIGEFSNISSISVTFSPDGVNTTYTLSAFGAGRIVKEQREKQKMIRKISNLEDYVFDLRNTIERQRLEAKMKSGAWGAGG